MNKPKLKTAKVFTLIALTMMTITLVGLISIDAKTITGKTVRFVDASDDKLIGKYYEGDSDRGVLLLEGFGSDTIPMRNFLSEYLRQNFHVFNFDFSGQGKSPGIVGFDNAATERFAKQVLSAKEKFKAISGLNDSQIVIVGHSMGARMGLQAATLDANEVAGLVLIGTQLNLDNNLQSSFFTGVNDSELEWVQDLNSTNPNVDIYLASGTWDDVLPKDSAQLLYDKLTSTPASNATRELEFFPATFHNYEVYSPTIIDRAIRKAYAFLGEAIPRCANFSALRPSFRLFFWINGLIGLFLGLIFGSKLLPQRNTREDQVIVDIDVKPELHVLPEIPNQNRYLWMKLLMLFASLPIAVLVASLFLAIPVGVPVFNIIYVGIFAGLGFLMLLLFRIGKMPGSSGKWKPNWKNKSIWHWKSILWTSLFFIGVLIFVVFFTRSGFFYVFPLNSRLLWLFLFTLFSIPGFYIGQLEYDMLKKDTHKLLQFNIFNTLIVLIPFFLQTLLFLILGSTSGFLGGIHGLVILMIVFLIGPIVRKISNNPLLTAIIQSFLLQLLVIPQGSLFLVFY